MYARILVPIDGRPCSEHAAFEAFDLARRFGSQVILAHVLPEGRARPGRESSGRLEACARALLDRWERVGRTSGVRASTRLLYGRDPASAVAALARDEAADLVLVGTRGRVSLGDRTLLGSTAERLTRASSVPVMLVRRQPAARLTTGALDRSGAQEMPGLPALAASPSDWSASD